MPSVKKTHQVNVDGVSAYCGRRGDGLRLANARDEPFGTVVITCVWCRQKLGLSNLKHYLRQASLARRKIRA